MAEQLICNEKSVAVREGTFLPTLQSPYNFTFATVAQLVEQLTRKKLSFSPVNIENHCTTRVSGSQVFRFMAFWWLFGGYLGEIRRK